MLLQLSALLELCSVQTRYLNFSPFMIEVLLLTNMQKCFINHTCKEYLNGVKSFIRAAEKDMLNQRKSAMCCPCVDCENDRKFTSSMHVHAHLIIRDFMDDYKYWNKHGEGGINY